MRVSWRVLVGAGLLILATTVPLEGQSFRQSVGFHGGGSWFSELSPTEGVETKLATSWLAGLQIERWFGRGRVGIRLNGAFSERLLDTGDHSTFNLYASDLSLLFRLLPPNTRRGIVPYIGIGGGAMMFNSATGPSVASNFYTDPTIKPMARAMIGTDLFASSPVGLQLEVADQVFFDSPFGVPGAASEFRPIHHAIGRIALQFRWDRLPSDPPVFVAAPPPPSRERVVAEPEPEREPEPEPEPERESPRTPPAPASVVADATVDSIRAAVDANTNELARLNDRLLDLERTLDQRIEAGIPRTASRARSERLYTVQVGAYLKVEAANGMAASMRATGVPVWVSRATVKGRTFHRVRMGAATTRADAMQLARHLQAQYRVPTWVTVVVSSDSPPNDAVTATRAALGGN